MKFISNIFNSNDFDYLLFNNVTGNFYNLYIASKLSKILDYKINASYEQRLQKLNFIFYISSDKILQTKTPSFPGLSIQSSPKFGFNIEKSIKKKTHSVVNNSQKEPNDSKCSPEIPEEDADCNSVYHGILLSASRLDHRQTMNQFNLVLLIGVNNVERNLFEMTLARRHLKIIKCNDPNPENINALLNINEISSIFILFDKTINQVINENERKYCLKFFKCAKIVIFPSFIKFLLSKNEVRISNNILYLPLNAISIEKLEKNYSDIFNENLT